MRLFGKVDGTVDRYDRAGWLTCPFDLAFIRRAAAGAEIVSFILNICQVKRFEANVCQTLPLELNICRTKSFVVER